MKKALMLSLAALAVAALVAGAASDAQASKYKKMRTSIVDQPSSSVGSAEKVRSMDDCMSYSANHVSKGRSADRSMFERQFGAPTMKNGATWSFNYDNYTCIQLDCSRRSCYTRCMSK